MTRTQKDTQTGGQSQIGSPKTTRVSTLILMSVQTHSGGSHKVVAATSGEGNKETQDHLGEEGLHFTEYTYFICIFIMSVLFYSPHKSAYKKETSQQL